MGHNNHLDKTFFVKDEPINIWHEDCLENIMNANDFDKGLVTFIT
jgi:hypothetical protein